MLDEIALVNITFLILTVLSQISVLSHSDVLVGGTHAVYSARCLKLDTIVADDRLVPS